jgi:hypothetical protein
MKHVSESDMSDDESQTIESGSIDFVGICFPI